MDKKQFNIFIASSMAGEFRNQRKDLATLIDGVNKLYKTLTFEWIRPEVMSASMTKEGKQEAYDKAVRDSHLFFLIVGREMGEFTLHEFQIAWRQYFSLDFPRIFPYFLMKGGEMPEEKTWNFWRLIQNFGHYPQTFADWESVKQAVTNQLVIFASEVEPSEGAEGASAEEIQKRIRENEREAGALINEGLTLEKLPEVLKLYNENDQLQEQTNEDSPPERKEAREEFLMGGRYADDRLYERAEQSYRKALAMYREAAKDNPTAYESDIAEVYNALGNLLSDVYRMEEAEAYYREAMETYRRLAKDNPAAFEPDVAMTCNNLAILLKDTNRMEEAEAYYREALEIRRRLAKGNPGAFELDVAMTCNNLGNLLKNTNRMEEAEAYYREALEIRRRLAKGNAAAFEPDVAQACNNLAILLKNTNRIEEAEAYYHEALEIRRRLAKGNAAAFEPDVATTCYNLGLFERDRGNRDAARRYFEEALSLYEKFPHLAQDAQDCRDKLAELDEPGQNAPSQT